jgi:UDP-N-acetylglucosamine 2-epimerase (non-hydrolysing)
MKILHVVGARPNFMKAAPVLRALESRTGIEQLLIHTGQHFDADMSAVFFDALQMPEPDYFLDINGGSQTEITARIMLAIEPILRREAADWVFVYGDVNSTVAAALVAAKLGIRIAHVEAGLRSWDRTMPEELNRIVTDQLADRLFTPSVDADDNLRREGIADAKIHFVGNVMIDSLRRALPLSRPPKGVAISANSLLVTLHRPSNVDDPKRLCQLLDVLQKIAQEQPVLFPVHPRTRKMIDESEGSADRWSAIQWLPPQGYLEFLYLLQHCAAVVTDSGGIQEETTYLNKPCVTLRKNTERPITLTQGTNCLLDPDAMDTLPMQLRDHCAAIQGRDAQKMPTHWDGQAAQRIADLMVSEMGRDRRADVGGQISEVGCQS